jgi:hypothetical protein
MKDDISKPNTKFVCRECKVVFKTKDDSLELHKRKSRHFCGIGHLDRKDEKSEMAA